MLALAKSDRLSRAQPATTQQQRRGSGGGGGCGGGDGCSGDATRMWLCRNNARPDCTVHRFSGRTLRLLGTHAYCILSCARLLSSAGRVHRRGCMASAIPHGDGLGSSNPGRSGGAAVGYHVFPLLLWPRVPCTTGSASTPSCTQTNTTRTQHTSAARSSRRAVHNAGTADP